MGWIGRVRDERESGDREFVTRGAYWILTAAFLVPMVAFMALLVWGLLTR